MHSCTPLFIAFKHVLWWYLPCILDCCTPLFIAFKLILYIVTHRYEVFVALRFSSHSNNNQEKAKMGRGFRCTPLFIAFKRAEEGFHTSLNPQLHSAFHRIQTVWAEDANGKTIASLHSAFHRIQTKKCPCLTHRNDFVALRFSSHSNKGVVRNARLLFLVALRFSSHSNHQA